MRLFLESFDGTDLNDSSFESSFAQGTVLLHQGVDPVLVPRENNSPVLTYVARKPAQWVIQVKLLGTIATQVDTLKALFNPDDRTLKTLLVSDAADSNKQWYVECICTSIVGLDGQLYIVNLLVPEPIWKTNTQTSDSWSITASGQTHDVTIGGNVDIPPVFRITPTAAKSVATDGYKHLVTIYSQAYFDTVNLEHQTSQFSNYPIDITAGGFNTAVLIADNGNKAQLNGAINASVTTVAIDTVTGAIPTVGMGYIDTEQLKWTGYSGGNLTGVTRGIGGTTAASHLDNAEIKLSYMLTNGDDIRVIVNGQPVDRWFGVGANALNTTVTKIWVNTDLDAVGYSGHYALRAAIAGTGAITTISMGPTSATSTYSAFGNPQGTVLPASSFVLIGSEVFSYTTLDPSSRQLAGVTRAQLGTSEAAHAIGDMVHLLKYEIWLQYGDQNASTPTIDNTRKPVFRGDSTNTSWDYDDFASTDGLRTGGWIPAVVSSTAPANLIKTKAYTTSQAPDTPVNPAAVGGAKIGAWLNGASWQSETGQVTWTLINPAGFTVITVTGFKYRTNSSWPATAGLDAAPYINPTWSSIWTDVTPGSATTWTALASHSSVSLAGSFGSSKNVRLNFSGSVGNNANQYSALEFTDVTLTLDNTRTPVVALGTQIGPVAGYPLDCRITNTDNSNEWLEIETIMQLNDTVEIDCENKQVTNVTTGAIQSCALRFSSVRTGWLNLLAGVANTLSFTDVGTAGVTFVTKTRERKL